MIIPSPLSFILKRILQRMQLLQWKINCLLTSSQKLFLFTLQDGSIFHYKLNSLVGKALFLKAFETQEVCFLKKILKEGDIFFDIGANGGFYTVIASKIVGTTGHIYSFEPSKEELELLQLNVSTNNIENATLVKKAVSNSKGYAQFALSKDGAMNSLLKNSHPGQTIQEWQEVELTTVDDFIKELAISKVDFMKIDVEGAEKLVFEGANKTLSKFENTVILFEACDLTSKGFGYSTEDFLTFLMQHNFFLYHIDNTGSLVPILEYNKMLGKSIYNFVGCKVKLDDYLAKS